MTAIGTILIAAIGTIEATREGIEIRGTAHETETRTVNGSVPGRRPESASSTGQENVNVKEKGRGSASAKGKGKGPESVSGSEKERGRENVTCLML